MSFLINGKEYDLDSVGQLAKDVAQLTKERDDLVAQLKTSEKEKYIAQESAKLSADLFAEERAKCAEMREMLQDVFDVVELIDGEECHFSEGITKALSDQCGVGWLSPDKKKVLVEALLRMIYGREDDPKDSNDLSAGEISVGDLRAAKQALEAAQ